MSFAVGEFPTLKALRVFAAAATNMKEIRLPAENRRALLGEFLEQDDVTAAVQGRYDMGNGEWELYTWKRTKVRITAMEKES